MEFVLLSMIVLIMIVAIVASRLASNSYPFPFNRKEALFTNAERTFQVLLERAVGDKYRVVSRVRLADLVTIRNGVSKQAAEKAVGMAGSKYLDFVICNKETMAPCGVIDLVNTQGKGYKIKKDWFVSGALEASSIPHIRIKVKAGYTVDEIRLCVNKHIIGAVPSTPKVPATRIPATLVKPRPKRQPVGTGLAPALSQSQARTELAQLPH